LDFVYVDGYAHTGQEGGRTLDQWWAKVRPGGIMAGHDYHEQWPLTVQAVNQFAARIGLAVHLTHEDEFPSWYFFKKTPPKAPLYPSLPGCPVAAGESCVLVGNGPSVLRGERGALIDSYSQVVRFNHFKVLGLESHTGSKTSLWCTYAKDYTPQDGIMPQRILYMHGDKDNPPYRPDELWRIPGVFYRELRAELKAASSLPQESLKDLIPSSGLLVARWLVSWGVTPHLVGFDHFMKSASPLHHYWHKKGAGLPVEHDGEAEAALFIKLASQGRIVYL